MRVTARGVGLLAAAVGALIAGFAFGYPELVVLGTAGLVAVGFALAYAAWRPALHVRRAADPDRVPRGDACTVTLTVGNSSRLRAATLVAEDRCGARTVPVPLVRLRPRRDTEVSYPVPTDRRGVVPIGPLRVTRQDPLGLVALSQGHGGTVRVWVYPRVHPLTAVPAGVARSLDGRVDRVPHGSITFDALREYVIGDELRHVHWRTSARVGQLMVREHLDTSLPRMVVLLDNRAAAHPQARGGYAETFEAACEAAASILAAAVREELPVALHLVAAGTPGADEARRGAAALVGGRWGTPGPRSGRATASEPPRVSSGGRRAMTARPFLDLLAEATLSTSSRLTPLGPTAAGGGPSGGEPADGALRTAVDGLRQHPAGDTLIYLTGPAGRPALGQVASLRGRYPSLLAVVFDADGGDPAAAGGSARGDGLVVLDARDGDDFAAQWEGSRRW